jgi:CrcB protein
MTWVAIGVGASLGAWLRYLLGLWLNTLQPQLPLGTLAANLGGGYIIGLAFGFFSSYPQLSPEWRLFVITGFLGGLTTFSTFSLEAMQLMQRGDYGWMLLHTISHLLGSVLLCAAGFATWRYFQYS